MNTHWRRSRVAWREALSQDFIAFPPGSGGRTAMQDALERAGLTLDPVMTFAQSTTVLGMVEAGIGVTAIPALGCPARDHKSLCSRDLVEPVVDRELGILRAAHTAPGTAMLALQEAHHRLRGAVQGGRDRVREGGTRRIGWGGSAAWPRVRLTSLVADLWFSTA
ncbi:LysR substrate-binding domain-containing protein [Pseudoroseomonas wenyumeiae]